VAKKTKPKNDAVMTGILETRFQMGQITVEELELMTKDLSKTERASAAEKVLAGIRGAGEVMEGIPHPDPMPKPGQDGQPGELQGEGQNER
jgi:hypothetical protein